MKKINLILSACVIAASALLASCNNGPQDLTNVRTTSYRYAYTVTGSLSITNKTGATTAYNVNTSTANIKDVIADVHWTEDALNDWNFQRYDIDLVGTADWTSSNTPAGGTETKTKSFNKFGFPTQQRLSFTIPEDGYYNYLLLREALSLSDVVAAYVGDSYPNFSSSTYVPCNYYSEGETVYGGYGTVINDITIKFFEMGGDYYISFDNEYVKLPEDAFDGFLGDKEFTLKYSTTSDNRSYLTQAQKDDTAALNTTDISYNLSFKKVSAE